MADITAAHYFAGLLGVAMLRHWYVDGEVNDARMAQLRHVLDNIGEFPFSLRLNPVERELGEGYAEWSESYDGPNPLIEAETPAVRPLLERLCGRGVRALDAACGTGRHAATLAELGCDVVGVDRSEDMLAVARAKTPTARFESGDLESLPFDDGEFDVAIVSLALCHLQDPRAAIAELARVLRDGGSLVITDPHPNGALLGGQAFYGGITPGKPMTWVRNHCHSASTWLDAFARAGLHVELCVEPRFTDAQIEAMPSSFVFPDAGVAAATGLATLWIWHLEKAPTE